MAKGDNLEERLVDFAVMIIHLTDKMPSSRAGNHIAGQLLRSGTSPAAHYAEARGAESTNDFVHKLKVGLKELNESRVWLKVTIKSKMMPHEDLSHIYQECDELCRIVNASIKTSKQRKIQRT
ncbi:MAG: four helix bundle protein [Ardenticatenaceae bacterium]|nr:four helix bundle protein [Ardenticatenaceae bacterium]MCB8950050.1 four helix bundle protein [Ardenticatenaceae bacterium]